MSETHDGVDEAGKPVVTENNDGNQSVVVKEEGNEAVEATEENTNDSNKEPSNDDDPAKTVPSIDVEDNKDEDVREENSRGDAKSDPGVETQEEGQEDEHAPSPSQQSSLHPGISTRITTTPADDSGLVQPTLPAIPRGNVKADQMTNLLSRARRRNHQSNAPARAPPRARVPPKLVRLATVTVSPARNKPAYRGPSLYYEEPRRPQKVVSWEEATQSRPPLRIDMEGPGPTTYSPLNKPLMETNAPCFTFGTKCVPEKAGGSRTSWGKAWFQSDHVWHTKADYVREGLWPSPSSYRAPPVLGPRQKTVTEAPSFTFGHKQAFSIIKPGAHKEPSPVDYERQKADAQVLRRGPSFSHQFRREGTVLWSGLEPTPGPAHYCPTSSARVPHPAFSIRGLRGDKSHTLGPFSSI